MVWLLEAHLYWLEVWGGDGEGGVARPAQVIQQAPPLLHWRGGLGGGAAPPPALAATPPATAAQVHCEYKPR